MHASRYDGLHIADFLNGGVPGIRVEFGHVVDFFNEAVRNSEWIL